MLSNENSAVLDKVWAGFSRASQSNPGAVLDFINSLLFIKQLDETQAEKGKMSALSGKPMENPTFTKDQQDLRWRSFHYLEQDSLFKLFFQENGVLDFAKSLPEYSILKKFNKEDKSFIPSHFLLAETISLINQLQVRDNTLRGDMIKYLLQKSEITKKTSQPELRRVVHEPLHVTTPPQWVQSFRKVKLSSRFYKAFLFLFLIAFAITVIYISRDKPAAPVSEDNVPGLTKNTIEKDTLLMPAPENKKGEVNGEAKRTPEINAEKVSPAEDSVVAALTKKAAERTAQERATTKEPMDEARDKEPIANKTAGKIIGQYKILDKAYFHDKPDKSTRRNAFLLHWNNSYATLKALEEKNGFIYVVFRNHQNQTSKGWLLKKDLKPVE